MKNNVCLLSLLLLSVAAYAHEGHHDAPGSIPGRNGGVIYSLKEIYVEKVMDQSGVFLYPMTHEKKPLPVKEVGIKGTAQVGKIKNAKIEIKTAVVAEGADEHFVVNVGEKDSALAKKARHYQLNLVISYHGKIDKISIPVDLDS